MHEGVETRPNKGLNQAYDAVTTKIHESEKVVFQKVGHPPMEKK